MKTRFDRPVPFDIGPLYSEGDKVEPPKMWTDDNRASDDPKYWFFHNGTWEEITCEEYRLKAIQQSNYRNLATSHTVVLDYEDYYDVHP